MSCNVPGRHTVIWIITTQSDKFCHHRSRSPHFSTGGGTVLAVDFMRTNFLYVLLLFFLLKNTNYSCFEQLLSIRMFLLEIQLLKFNVD